MGNIELSKYLVGDNKHMFRICCFLIVLTACVDFVVIGSRTGTPQSFYIPLYFSRIQLHLGDDFGIQSVHLVL